MKGTVAAVSNRFLFGNRLLWQGGSVSKVLVARTAIVELNPRILTTWLLLVMRRVLRRPTVLWGHAWARRGRYPLSTLARRTMWRMASAVLLYTESEAEQVRAVAKGRVSVMACPNALYAREEMFATTDPDARGFLCVGRLIDIKRPLVLLEAFRVAAPSLGIDARLTYVGDGPRRQAAAAAIREMGLEDLVVMYGEITDVTVLRRIHAEHLATVSPGRAGLSMTQSFGFGVPMVVGWPWEHGPEIEALAEGQNGIRSASDLPESLAAALVELAEDRSRWLARRPAIAAGCADRYSLEIMIDRMLSAAALSYA
jgi:glycosyltransferase involved in cell wall biosynthesis